MCTIIDTFSLVTSSLQFAWMDQTLSCQWVERNDSAPLSASLPLHSEVTFALAVAALTVSSDVIFSIPCIAPAGPTQATFFVLYARPGPLSHRYCVMCVYTTWPHEQCT